MTEQETFYNEILAELENGSLVLPTLPEVALKVREVVDDPEVTATKLANIIITDPALSTRLVKVANSALYRGRMPVESVQMAVARMGLIMVKNLVTSLVMEQLFQASSDRLEKQLHELWEHSIEVASISLVIASKQPGIKNDEAMLAGLIHDIGVLPILLKAEQSPILLENTAMLDSLIARLHTRIGEAILRSWNFSESLIAVAAEHQNYDRDTGNKVDLVDIIQVANIQSYTAIDDVLSEEQLQTIKAFTKLNIDTNTNIVELDENSEEYAEALALFSAM